MIGKAGTLPHIFKPIQFVHCGRTALVAGNAQTKRSNEIYNIHDDASPVVVDTPCLAVPCTLEGVVPAAGEEWTEEANVIMRTAIHEEKSAEVGWTIIYGKLH